jgi:hypothetical protein
MYALSVVANTFNGVGIGELTKTLMLGFNAIVVVVGVDQLNVLKVKRNRW